MDKKVKDLIQEIIERIQILEEIAVTNNNLLGFLITGHKGNQMPFSELKSVYLTGEMIEYLQNNNISIDFIADA